MQKFEWFMGIDVSKSKLDVTLLKGDIQLFHQEIENNKKSLMIFIKSLKAEKEFDWSKCLVCVEHTGIYNNHLLLIAEQFSWQLCLESAVQIKQSGGLQRGKNDIVDSYRIALYACKNASFLKLWKPTRMVLTTLQKLGGLRHRLIVAKKQLACAIKEDGGFLDKGLLKTLTALNKQPMQALEKGIQEIDAKIVEVIKSDTELTRLFGLIESIPGVGKVTALQLVVTTNGFISINDPRKYACYSGIAPFEHSSGSSLRGRTRTSKKANQHVKSMLHMCSLVAIQHCPEIKIYYQRKVAEGKNKMCVLNAVKNKIIHRIFACVNQNRVYEKKYQSNLVVS